MPGRNLLETQVVLQMLSWEVSDQTWMMLNIGVINESFYKENANAPFTLEKNNSVYACCKKYISNK